MASARGRMTSAMGHMTSAMGLVMSAKGHAMSAIPHPPAAAPTGVQARPSPAVVASSGSAAWRRRGGGGRRSVPRVPPRRPPHRPCSSTRARAGCRPAAGPAAPSSGGRGRPGSGATCGAHPLLPHPPTAGPAQPTTLLRYVRGLKARCCGRAPPVLGHAPMLTPRVALSTQRLRLWPGVQTFEKQVEEKRKEQCHSASPTC